MDVTQYHTEYDHATGITWFVRTETPRWAILVTEYADKACGLTGHVFCGLFYTTFGRLLFCEDVHAREVERVALSAKLALRLRTLILEAYASREAAVTAAADIFFGDGDSAQAESTGEDDGLVESGV